MSCIELPECLRERSLPVSQPRWCVHRRRDRKLHADVEVALIFIRHKAGGQAVAKEKRAQTKENEQHHHEPALANYRVGPPHKTIGAALPIAIERVKEFPERSAAPVAAFL